MRVKVIQIHIAAFLRQNYTSRSNADASTSATTNENAFIETSSVVKKLIDFI